MRKLLYILLLVVPHCLHGDAAFDSVFVKSDAIIYGLVIRHEISPFQADKSARTYTADIVINTICYGMAPINALAQLAPPGDTITQLTYIGGDDDDTLLRDRYYVFLMNADSSGWHLTEPDYHKGIFRDYSLLSSHCNILFVLPDPKNPHSAVKIEESTQNGWETVVTSDAMGNRVYVRKYKWKNGGRVTKYMEYGVNGDLIRKSRHKQKSDPRHEVTWLFRDDGKRCLKRRSVWILD